MKIREVIETIKSLHYGMHHGEKIDPLKSRDQILYGDPDQECTGIVTTCFASSDVLRKAKQINANLIIPHEALFWNRGDKTDWLEDNKVFQKKKQILDSFNGVVWRDHDYIHSGIDIDGKWCDGIFYGLMEELGWKQYLIDDEEKPLLFKIPETDLRDLSRQLMGKLGLNGIRLVGRKEGPVSKVYVAEHIVGKGDEEKITKIEREDIDVIITLELIDYTVAEYIRDAAQNGFQKTILAIGHFNTEEAGMKYLASYLQKNLKDLPVTFIRSGDSYSYIIDDTPMHDAA